MHVFLPPLTPEPWAGYPIVMAKKKSAPPIALRNRIKEYKSIPASAIENAPWNFRRHPEAQNAALAGSINELGFYDPLKVYVTAAGAYRLVDGEARKTLITDRIGPATEIPVVVLDFTELEAKQALATHDALSAMAVHDNDRLNAMLKDLAITPFADPALEKMLADLRGGLPEEPEAAPGGGGDDFDAVPEPGWGAAALAWKSIRPTRTWCCGGVRPRA